jgi:bacterioferritin-associated ferredoxin
VKKTVVCLCHDVTEADLRRMFAQGYTDPETLKRSTGAFMGPCQGKFCAPAVLAIIAELTGEDRARVPTSRPPLVPVPMGLLASAASLDDDHEGT